MAYFLVLLFFAIFLIAMYKNKCLYHPTVVFCLVWAFIVFLDGLHLYGLNISGTITYLVIGIGVVFFCFGVLLSRCLQTEIRIHSNRQTVYTVRYTLFYAFFAVTLLLLSYPALTNLFGVLNGSKSFVDIRDSFGNPYTNIVLRLIYNYIVNPFSNACLPIFAVIIIGEKNKSRTIVSLILLAVLLLFRILADAGRGILFYFLSMLLFSYIISKQEKKVSKKKSKKLRKYILIFVIVAIIIYATMTILRGASGTSSIIKQVYVYICGCVPFLDFNLKQIISADVNLFGFGGFHGFFEFVFTMLDNVGLVNYPELMVKSDLWYQNSLETIEIGGTTVFNAYATLFYNTFLDGGFFGTSIEMIIYGLICGYFYFKLKYKKDIKTKAIYLYLLYGLVFSFVRFQFSLSSHFLAFVMISLMFKKRKVFVYESASNQCCLSNW